MADPKIAFSITISPSHEGGFQNNPNDSGNWTGGKVGEGELRGTKYGISAAQFPDEDIENMTPERAIEIYTEKYWPLLYSDIQSQDFANKLADIGVPFGVGTAIIVVQTLLELKADGIFGPMTLRAVNEYDPISLIKAFKSTFVTHALNIGMACPEKREFVAGWIRRINS
jgi:lysozyme family protein